MENKETLQPKDSLWISTAADYYAIQKQRKELEELEEILKKDLIRLSDNKTAFGGNLIFSLTIRKGSIVYKNIPELKNVDLDLYRSPKPVEIWKIQQL